MQRMLISEFLQICFYLDSFVYDDIQLKQGFTNVETVGIGYVILFTGKLCTHNNTKNGLLSQHICK